MNHKNIFNIPLQVNFLATFSEWFIKKFSNINCTVIFTHQACVYDFTKNIFHKTKCLPTVKAIDQISISDLSNLININEKSAETISSLTQYKVLSKLASLLRLVEIIKEEQIFKQTNVTYFKIALDFLDIFYSLENEQINLEQLNQLDDSNLAEHRLITLEFIKNFYCKIKNRNLKDNILFAESFANHLRKTFSELIDNHSLKQPLIIVGSSGSINSTLQLIGSIAKQKQGYVVLHGLSQQNFLQLPPENHPQYFLQRIVNQHNIQPNEIININSKTDQNFAEIVLHKLFLPAKQTITWQKDEQLSNFLAMKAQKNLKIIKCSNYFGEADFITQTIIDNPYKKIGVVIYDNNFLPFLTLNLQQKNIVFDNKITQPIHQHKLFSLFFLLYQVKNENLNPYTLSALIRHQLFDIKPDNDLLYWFELFVLRQPIIAKNLVDLIAFLTDNICEKSYYHKEFYEKSTKNDKKFTTEIQKQIIDFLKQLINYLPKENSLASYIKSIEKIANKQLSDILNSDLVIKQFIEELILLNYQIQNLDELKCIVGSLSYFSDKSNNSNIVILSNLEARLLNFDLLIVANANESFLPQTQDGGLIGNKIKTDLNINLNQKRFGQSAFDFCSYFQQTQIFFTYSNTNTNGKINKISPFLLKFQVLVQKIVGDLSTNLLDLIFIQHTITSPSLPYLPINKPEVKVCNSRKPQQFSISNLYKLIANPYCFYVKEILKLSALSNFNSHQESFATIKITEDIINHYFEKNDFCENYIDEKLQFYFLEAGNVFLHKIWLTNVLENFQQKIIAEKQNYTIKTQEKISFNQQYLGQDLYFADKINLILSYPTENKLIQYAINQKDAEQKDFILNYYQFFYAKNNQNQSKATNVIAWNLKKNDCDKKINTKKLKNYQEMQHHLDLLMLNFLQENYLFTYIKSKFDYYTKFTRQQEWQCQQLQEEDDNDYD